MGAGVGRCEACGGAANSVGWCPHALGAPMPQVHARCQLLPRSHQQLDRPPRPAHENRNYVTTNTNATSCDLPLKFQPACHSSEAKLPPLLLRTVPLLTLMCMILFPGPSLEGLLSTQKRLT